MRGRTGGLAASASAGALDTKRAAASTTPKRGSVVKFADQQRPIEPRAAVQFNSTAPTSALSTPPGDGLQRSQSDTRFVPAPRAGITDPKAALQTRMRQGVQAKLQPPLQFTIDNFLLQAQRYQDASYINLCRGLAGRPRNSSVNSKRRIQRNPDSMAASNAKKNRAVIIVLGPPAAGRHELCKRIAKEYGYVLISSGAILREHVRKGTAVGVQAKFYMEKGDLVPSEMVMDVMKDKMCAPEVEKFGGLLDGFPRSVNQVQALRGILDVDLLFVIDVPDKVLMDRLEGRRLDPKTGKMYHLTIDPPPPTSLARCVTRPEDTRRVFRCRLDQYHTQIDPITTYFDSKMRKLDGTDTNGVFNVISVILSSNPRFAKVARSPEEQATEEAEERRLEMLENANEQENSNDHGGSAAGARIIAICGPPCSGKGTQCERLCEKYGFVHVSSGDILRDNVKRSTELGKQAKTYIDAGELVPSDLVVEIMAERLQGKDVRNCGCVLKGFPRNREQAEAMEEKITLSSFIVLEVPEGSIVERAVGRRIDPQTGSVYHLTFQPPPLEVQSRLVRRDGDAEEVLKVRLDSYKDNLEDLVSCFDNIVARVNGGLPSDIVFQRIVDVLEGEYEEEPSLSSSPSSTKKKGVAFSGNVHLF